MKKKISNGATILAAKKISNHPDDKHLFTVLARWQGNMFGWIVWNTYDNNTQGCTGGHYYRTQAEALKKFLQA